MWQTREMRQNCGNEDVGERFALFAAGALAISSAAAASAQLIKRKDLSLTVAQTIANGALEGLQGDELRRLGRRAHPDEGVRTEIFRPLRKRAPNKFDSAHVWMLEQPTRF